MTLALHHLPDMHGMGMEIRRLLVPGGALLLYEWDRTSFERYLERWGREPETMDAEDWTHAFEHFGMTCRFAVEDWRYLLGVCGFRVETVADLGDHLSAFVCRADAG